MLRFLWEGAATLFEGATLADCTTAIWRRQQSQNSLDVSSRQVCLLVGNSRRASTYAVNYFMTKYLGVRWIGPGALGELVPLQPAWQLESPIDDLQSPDYAHRD